MLKSCFDELNKEFSVCSSFCIDVVLFSLKKSFRVYMMIKITMMFDELNQEFSVC